MVLKVKPGKLDCISLIRVSSDEQAAEDKGGIPAQEFAINKVAEQHNLNIKWKIQIAGVSGADVEHAPGMKELRRIVESGACKGLILKEQSRLFRPENFEFGILGFLSKHKVNIYSPDGLTDFETPSGKCVVTILSAVAGMERTVIRDRMVGGKRAKRSRGEWSSGKNTVPLGFKIVVDAAKLKWLRPDEATMPRVLRLFNLFTSGTHSYTKLSRLTGISYDSVRYILQNEIYTGWHVVKTTRDPHGKVLDSEGKLRYQHKLIIPKDEQERIQILKEPPVPLEMFARAQQIIQSKSAMRSKPKSGIDDPFIYRGMLRCALCKLPMTTVRYRSHGQRFAANYYACKGTIGSRSGWNKDAETFNMRIEYGTCSSLRVRQDRLDPQLDNIVETTLASDDFLTLLIEAHNKRAQGCDVQDESAIVEEIAKLGRAIERNRDMYTRERIDVDEFDSRDDKLKAELRVCKKALRDIKPPPPQITAETWEPFREALSFWHSLEVEQKRSILIQIGLVFEVAGYAGDKYHETRIEVSDLNLNLGFDESTVVKLKIDAMQVA
jgi:DNA invertase Pin-like site-specific DNA recombinase